MSHTVMIPGELYRAIEEYAARQGGTTATVILAWATLEKYLDEECSLLDAASFVVMGRIGIVKAFTTEHHFAHAGLLPTPRSSDCLT